MLERNIALLLKVTVLDELYFICPPTSGICYSAPAPTRSDAWRNWIRFMCNESELTPERYRKHYLSWYRSGYRCHKLKVCRS